MIKKGKVRYDKKGRKLPDGISQRKDGRYQIRITVHGKQHVEYSWDLAEAKKLLREMQSKLDDGSLNGSQSLTLNEWYFKWLMENQKGKLKQRTYNNYANYYNKNIRDTSVGRMKISKIKQIHLLELYKELTERNEKPLAHATVLYINSMIGSCFQEAIDRDLIMKNPAIGVMKKVGGRSEKKRNALTEDQENVFLDYITEGRYAVYKPMFTVLFKSGLRSGELRALTAEDVDITGGWINVDKSVNYDVQDGEIKKEFYITPPKTDSSNRPIPMLGEVKEAFIQQKEYKQVFNIDNSYSIRRFDDKNKYIGMCTGFIFTTSKGTIATEESLNRTIKAIINEYNMKENKKAVVEGRDAVLLPIFTMHYTRHTFATQAYRKKMRGLSISAIMGQCREDSKIRYTHPDFDILKKDMEEAWGA